MIFDLGFLRVEINAPEPILAELDHLPRTERPADLRYRTVGGTLLREGEPLGKFDGTEAFFDLLGDDLLQLFYDHGDYLLLHSAAVARDEALWLFAGASGSGKSTLTAALLRRGFDYLGDDFLLFHLPTERWLPLPLPLKLRPHVKSRFPEIVPHRLPLFRFRPFRLEKLFFPLLDLERDLKAELQELRPSLAAFFLLDSVINRAVLGPVALDWAVVIAEHCPACQLPCSNPDEALLAMLTASSPSVELS